MSLVASRIGSIPRAGIRVIFDAARGIEDVLHLEIGQPDFPTPPAVCEAAVSAIRNGQTRYTPNAGDPELREAIAAHLRASKHVDVAAENIVVTTGGMGALATTFEAVLNPGEEVLLPDPGWPNYAMQVLCAGGVPVYYDLEATDGYQPDPDALEAKVTSRTKALLLNFPSNPTGAVVRADVAARLVELARRRGLLIVSDEVYEDIVFEPGCPSFLRPDTLESAVGVYSFSKTYAMTGWRVGYLAAPRELAEEITKLQEVYYACASSVSQAAARAALDVDRAVVVGMADAYRRRRDIVADGLNAMGIGHFLPQGAFYCLVDIAGTKMHSMDFAMDLLRSKHVAVAPGETFGGNAARCVRICFAVRDDLLRDGVRRLGEFIRERQG